MEKGSMGVTTGEHHENGLILLYSLDTIFSEDLYNNNNKAEKEIEQLDDLVNRNSTLYKHARWKVLLSDDFRRSFGKLTNNHLKKLVLSILLKLTAGWRPKNTSVDLSCKHSSLSLKQESNIEGLYIVCTIDIIKDINYVQVMKVWDILAFEEIPTLIKRLKNMFSEYTEAYIKRCTSKRVEGNLEVPRCWPVSHEMIRFRHNDEVSMNSVGGRIYVENLKVGESLLLMKFYPLSPEVVCHLLSGKDVNLPMQATDEQMDIIQSRKSSFIIGRSGTGKTTILTMKLFQNEHLHCNDSEALYEVENNPPRDVKAVNDPENSNPSFLRQLFVTVSPRLCHVVKQQVSHLTSTSCNGNPSVGIHLGDADASTEFSDIPDTFIDTLGNIYPLVITFQKFLMMLDGTIGNSFFERFFKVRKGSCDDIMSSSFVPLQRLIRSREVTFDRFFSLYWPHFNLNLTKKLDPSRVFTEIISHIKGGSDGNLSSEAYSLLAESRSSTLSKEKREIVYTLFETYEKMKSERGEFDSGDFVNDIHLRLKNETYEGDQMDFVYIDEVQDLTMRQISLFKYICQNVREGFIFAGDTAQTIARGIDFRFQDIRSLFYKEFLSTATTDKQEKCLVSEIKQLKQNFRTHAGVLDLAQSVIDILYCYFIHSIDKLEPEISHVYGEAPALLESVNDENAIVTIFGGSGSGDENVGFGAEQVILVRDDHAKTEVCELVGKNALVLTIVECKGLEFRDVLLYNFFGTSPLKDQWRVLYGYMKRMNLLSEDLPQSFPTYNEARHGILCSELKQLYVAITRTRQRLWICENKEELSKPMFDYWKRRRLVQVRKLDDSVAQSMSVVSTPQEWLERGKKFLYENNFVMASFCFERAGDATWEKLAKASSLRAYADQMRGTNPESCLGYLREAAGIFVSIGKPESAATCYCDLGEYETAAKIYLYACGKIDAAAECFMLAGCYSEAAEAYAKGDQFSNCLSVCKLGNLFDKGLDYINHWKDHVDVKSIEIQQTQQDFLEGCALKYHEHKDPKSMMKFVRSFCSKESQRMFLRSLGCLDGLMFLEEESGHFLEAAELARSCGDVSKEVDLLEKAGNYKEAASVLLWYVVLRSLWGNGNTGWPVKQFDQKEKLCNRIKSLAELDSEIFHDFVCSELKVLSDKPSSLNELKKDLDVSHKNKSLRGEILSFRRILDSMFHLSFSRYQWENELPADLNNHCEKMMFQNRASVRILAFYWNLWRENVVNIFESIESFHNDERNKHEGHYEFSLMYFGVRKQIVKGNTVYLVVDKDADWLRNYGQKGLHKDDKRLTVDGSELVSAMRSYWQMELLSVGLKVLETLECLYKSKLNRSAFHQSTSLLQIFEVSKFLLDSQYLNLTTSNTRKLQRYLGISSNYFDIVFPLDPRQSVSEDLLSLGETDLSVRLLDEIIIQNLDVNSDLTYRTIGRVMMICLGSRISLALYELILNKLQRNPAWSSFVKKFRDAGLRGEGVAPALQNALEDTFKTNWRCVGHISPHSFVYLLDRLMLMHTLTHANLFTTKSSFVGSFTHIHSTSSSPGPVYFRINSVMDAAIQIFSNREDTITWIKKSNIDISYHQILVLKIVMIVSLISLKETNASKWLRDILTGGHNISNFPKEFVLTGGDNISNMLPKKFVRILLRRTINCESTLDPSVVAEAFNSVGDPLLIVCLGNSSPEIYVPGAIFVDLKKSKEEIMSILFPRKNTHIGQTSANTLPDANLSMNPVEPRLSWKFFKGISDLFDGKKGELSLISVEMKKELDKDIQTLATVSEDANFCAQEDTTLLRGALDELKVLSEAFDMSKKELEHSVVIKGVDVATEWLQSNRPKIDDLLERYVMSQESNVRQMVVVSESSRMKNHIVETCDELQMKVVLEKQTSGGNTQEAKNKRGKGNNNKGKKGKRGKGKH